MALGGDTILLGKVDVDISPAQKKFEDLNVKSMNQLRRLMDSNFKLPLGRITGNVDEFTKSLGKYERQIRITSVVEQAIRELVMCNVQYAYGVKLEPRNERKPKSTNG